MNQHLNGYPKFLLSNNCFLRAIIYDLDGTVIDSFKHGFDVLKGIMERQERPMTPEIKTRLCNAWGKSGTDVISEGYNLSPQTAAEISKEWNIVSGDSLDKAIKVFPGARELICFSKKSGLVNTLFTSRDQPEGNYILLKFDLVRSFSFIWETGNLDLEFRKPRKRALEPTLNYLKQFHRIRPEECLLIGDCITDIECARNAGLGDAVLARGGPEQDISKLNLAQENILPSISHFKNWLEQRIIDN